MICIRRGCGCSLATDDPSLEVQAEEIEAIERKVWRGVDVTLYPSQEEVDQVKQLDPSVDARPLMPYCFDEFRIVEKSTSVSLGSSSLLALRINPMSMQRYGWSTKLCRSLGAK